MELYTYDELICDSPSMADVEAAFAKLKTEKKGELALVDSEVRELSVTLSGRSWTLVFQRGNTGINMFSNAKDSLAAFREFLVSAVPGVPLSPVKGGVLEALVADDFLDDDCPLCRMMKEQGDDFLAGA